MRFLASLLICSWAVLVTPAPEYLRSYQRSYTSSTSNGPPKYKTMVSQMQGALKKSLAQQCGSRTSCRTYYSSSHEGSSSNTNTDSTTNYNDQLMASLRQKVESQSSYSSSTPDVPTEYINMDPQVQEAIKKSLAQQSGYRTSYSRTYSSSSHEESSSNTNTDSSPQGNTATSSSRYTTSQSSPGYTRTTYSYVKPQTYVTGTDHQVNTHNLEHDREQDKNSDEQRLVPGGYSRTTSFSRTGSSSHSSSQNRPGYVRRTYTSSSSFGEPNSQFINSENKRTESTPHVHDDKCEHDVEQENNAQDTDNLNQHGTSGYRRTTYSSSSSTSYNSSRNRPQYTVTSYHSTSNLNSNRDSQVGVTENQENNENHEHRLEDNSDEDDDGQRIVNAGQYSKTTNSSRTVSHSSSSSTNYNSSRNRPQYTVTSYYSTSNLNSNRDSQVGLTENQENNENHEDRLEDNNDEDDDAQRIVNAGQYSKTANSSQTVSHSSSSSTSYNSSRNRPQYTVTSYHSTSNLNSNRDSQVGLTENQENNENHEHRLEDNNDEDDDAQRVVNAGQYSKTAKSSQTVSHSSSSSSGFSSTHSRPGYTRTTYHSTSSYGTPHSSVINKSGNKDNDGNLHIHSENCEHDIEKNNDDTNNNPNSQNANQQGTSGYSRTVSYSGSSSASHNTNRNIEQYSGTRYNSVTDSSTSSYSDVGSALNKQENNSADHIHSDKCEHDIEKNSVDDDEQSIVNKGQRTQTSGFTRTTSYSDSDLSSTGSNHYRPGYTRTTYHSSSSYGTQNSNNGDGQDNAGKLHVHSENCEHDKENSSDLNGSENHAQNVGRHRITSYSHTVSSNSRTTGFNSSQNRQGAMKIVMKVINSSTQNAGQHSQSAGHAQTISYYRAGSFIRNSSQSELGYSESTSSIDTNNSQQNNSVHGGSFEHGKNTVEQTTENLQQNSHTRGNYGTTSQSHSTSSRYTSNQIDRDIGQQSISTGHSHTGLTRYTSSHTSSEHRTASNYARNTTEKNINKEGSDENSSEEDEYDSAGNSNDKRNKPGGKGWKKYYWEKDFIPPGHRNKPHPRAAMLTGIEIEAKLHLILDIIPIMSSRLRTITLFHIWIKYNDGGRTTYTYSSGGVRYSTSNRNSSTTATDASQNVYEDKDTQFAPEVDGTGFEHGSYDTNTGTSAIDSDSRHSSNRSTSEYTQQNSHSNNNVSTHSGSTGYVPSRYSTSGSDTMMAVELRTRTPQNVYEGEDTQFAQELDGTGFEHGSYDTNTGTSAIDSDSRHSSNRSTFVSTHSGSTSANSEEKKHRSNVSMHSGSKTTNSSYTLVSQYSQSSHESNSAKHKVITDSSSDEDSYEILDQRTEKYEATTNSGDTFFENQNIVSNNYASTSKIVEDTSEESKQFVISHFTNKSAEHKSDNYASANNQQFNLQQNKENININKSATNLIESTTFTKYNFSSSEERNEQLQSGSLQISQQVLDSLLGSSQNPDQQPDSTTNINSGTNNYVTSKPVRYQYRPTNFKGDALSSHDFLENEKHKSNSEIKNASVDRNHHQQQSGSHGRNSSDIRSTSSISYSSQNISGQYHHFTQTSPGVIITPKPIPLRYQYQTSTTEGYSNEDDDLQKQMSGYIFEDKSHTRDSQRTHSSSSVSSSEQNIRQHTSEYQYNREQQNTQTKNLEQNVYFKTTTPTTLETSEPFAKPSSLVNEHRVESGSYEDSVSQVDTDELYGQSTYKNSISTSSTTSHPFDNDQGVSQGSSATSHQESNGAFSSTYQSFNGTNINRENYNTMHQNQTVNTLHKSTNSSRSYTQSSEVDSINSNAVDEVKKANQMSHVVNTNANKFNESQSANKTVTTTFTTYVISSDEERRKHDMESSKIYFFEDNDIKHYYSTTPKYQHYGHASNNYDKQTHHSYSGTTNQGSSTPKPMRYQQQSVSSENHSTEDEQKHLQGQTISTNSQYQTKENLKITDHTTNSHGTNANVIHESDENHSIIDASNDLNEVNQVKNVHNITFNHSQATNKTVTTSYTTHTFSSSEKRKQYESQSRSTIYNSNVNSDNNRNTGSQQQTTIQHINDPYTKPKPIRYQQQPQTLEGDSSEEDDQLVQMPESVLESEENKHISGTTYVKTNNQDSNKVNQIGNVHNTVFNHSQATNKTVTTGYTTHTFSSSEERRRYESQSGSKIYNSNVNTDNNTNTESQQQTTIQDTNNPHTKPKPIRYQQQPQTLEGDSSEEDDQQVQMPESVFESGSQMKTTVVNNTGSFHGEEKKYVSGATYDKTNNQNTNQQISGSITKANMKQEEIHNQDSSTEDISNQSHKHHSTFVTSKDSNKVNQIGSVHNTIFNHSQATNKTVTTGYTTHTFSSSEERKRYESQSGSTIYNSNVNSDNNRNTGSQQQATIEHINDPYTKPKPIRYQQQPQTLEGDSSEDDDQQVQMPESVHESASQIITTIVNNTGSSHSEENKHISGTTYDKTINQNTNQQISGSSTKANINYEENHNQDSSTEGISNQSHKHNSTIVTSKDSNKVNQIGNVHNTIFNHSQATNETVTTGYTTHTFSSSEEIKRYESQSGSTIYNSNVNSDNNRNTESQQQTTIQHMTYPNSKPMPIRYQKQPQTFEGDSSEDDDQQVQMPENVIESDSQIKTTENHSGSSFVQVNNQNTNQHSTGSETIYQQKQKEHSQLKNHTSYITGYTVQTTKHDSEEDESSEENTQQQVQYVDFDQLANNVNNKITSTTDRTNVHRHEETTKTAAQNNIVNEFESGQTSTSSTGQYSSILINQNTNENIDILNQHTQSSEDDNQQQIQYIDFDDLANYVNNEIKSTTDHTYINSLDETTKTSTQTSSTGQSSSILINQNANDNIVANSNNAHSQRINRTSTASSVNYISSSKEETRHKFESSEFLSQSSSEERRKHVQGGYHHSTQNYHTSTKKDVRPKPVHYQNRPTTFETFSTDDHNPQMQVSESSEKQTAQVNIINHHSTNENLVHQINQQSSENIEHQYIHNSNENSNQYQLKPFTTPKTPQTSDFSTSEENVQQVVQNVDFDSQSAYHKETGANTLVDNQHNQQYITEDIADNIPDIVEVNTDDLEYISEEKEDQQQHIENSFDSLKQNITTDKTVSHSEDDDEQQHIVNEFDILNQDKITDKHETESHVINNNNLNIGHQIVETHSTNSVSNSHNINIDSTNDLHDVNNLHSNKSRENQLISGAVETSAHSVYSTITTGSNTYSGSNTNIDKQFIENQHNTSDNSANNKYHSNSQNFASGSMHHSSSTINIDDNQHGDNTVGNTHGTTHNSNIVRQFSTNYSQVQESSSSSVEHTVHQTSSNFHNIHSDNKFQTNNQHVQENYNDNISKKNNDRTVTGSSNQGTTSTFVTTHHKGSSVDSSNNKFVVSSSENEYQESEHISENMQTTSESPNTNAVNQGQSTISSSNTKGTTSTFVTTHHSSSSVDSGNNQYVSSSSGKQYLQPAHISGNLQTSENPNTNTDDQRHYSTISGSNTKGTTSTFVTTHHSSSSVSSGNNQYDGSSSGSHYQQPSHTSANLKTTSENPNVNTVGQVHNTISGSHIVHQTITKFEEGQERGSHSAEYKEHRINSNSFANTDDDFETDNQHILVDQSTDRNVENDNHGQPGHEINIHNTASSSTLVTGNNRHKNNNYQHPTPLDPHAGSHMNIDNKEHVISSSSTVHETSINSTNVHDINHDVNQRPLHPSETTYATVEHGSNINTDSTTYDASSGTYVYDNNQHRYPIYPQTYNRPDTNIVSANTGHNNQQQVDNQQQQVDYNNQHPAQTVGEIPSSPQYPGITTGNTMHSSSSSAGTTGYNYQHQVYNHQQVHNHQQPAQTVGRTPTNPQHSGITTGNAMHGTSSSAANTGYNYQHQVYNHQQVPSHLQPAQTVVGGTPTNSQHSGITTGNAMHGTSSSAANTGYNYQQIYNHQQVNNNQLPTSTTQPIGGTPTIPQYPGITTGNTMHSTSSTGHQYGGYHNVYPNAGQPNYHQVSGINSGSATYHTSSSHGTTQITGYSNQHQTHNHQQAGYPISQHATSNYGQVNSGTVPMQHTREYYMRQNPQTTNYHAGQMHHTREYHMGPTHHTREYHMGPQHTREYHMRPQHTREYHMGSSYDGRDRHRTDQMHHSREYHSRPYYRGRDYRRRGGRYPNRGHTTHITKIYHHYIVPGTNRHEDGSECTHDEHHKHTHNAQHGSHTVTSSGTNQYEYHHHLKPGTNLHEDGTECNHDESTKYDDTEDRQYAETNYHHVKPGTNVHADGTECNHSEDEKHKLNEDDYAENEESTIYDVDVETTTELPDYTKLETLGHVLETTSERLNRNQQQQQQITDGIIDSRNDQLIEFINRKRNETRTTSTTLQESRSFSSQHTERRSESFNAAYTSASSQQNSREYSNERMIASNSSTTHHTSSQERLRSRYTDNDAYRRGDQTVRDDDEDDQGQVTQQLVDPNFDVGQTQQQSSANREQIYTSNSYGSRTSNLNVMHGSQQIEQFQTENLEDLGQQQVVQPVFAQTSIHNTQSGGRNDNEDDQGQVTQQLVDPNFDVGRTQQQSSVNREQIYTSNSYGSRTSNSNVMHGNQQIEQFQTENLEDLGQQQVVEPVFAQTSIHNTQVNENTQRVESVRHDIQVTNHHATVHEDNVPAQVRADPYVPVYVEEVITTTTAKPAWWKRIGNKVTSYFKKS
ncbi:uncharacterized protein LOC113370838 [Ctenocephalides felis]|uniref:uncharacterized protein LOC113370838 n=1 Tax=Ctenocephalides felis TaxID=7515 RepID=UPI000E6E3B26|nr:uncharacterized protein LOC113370838 [Ctenocephalides felis]